MSLLSTTFGRPRVERDRATPDARVVRSVVAAFGCALMVGCGGQPRLIAPNQQTPSIHIGTPNAAVTAAATPVSDAPSIGEIVWVTSSDPETNAPADVVTDYPTDAPRLTASAPGSALPTGSTIDAAWEYNDTSLDAFATQIVTAEPADRTWISFHLDRDPATPWPAGAYEVTISLNGTQTQQSTVEVVAQN